MYHKKEIAFQVDGVSCRGVLHLPEGRTNPPVVVMGNGYATEWQFGTQGHIESFTNAGIATLNFDYRGFGASDAKAGEPRQIVDIPAQLDDWRAAISYAQQSPDVDGTKLAVWGSSLGGGHAITMAAEHPGAKALVAQVPHCCSNAAFKTVALGAVFKGMSYSIADNLRGLFGMKPLLVPVLSQPNEYGVMNHPGWKDHYLSLVNAESRWQNQIPARSLIKSGQYRPVLDAGKIAMPALLVYGRHDAGVPASSVEEAGAKMSNAELMPFEGDHFDVYGGPLHPGIVEKQTAFLVANLLP